MNYQLIPVELCEYVYRNRLVNSFRLFMYLKTHSKPVFQLSESCFDEWMKDLSIKSAKTLNKHLDKLFELQWLRKSKSTNTVFVSGFDWIKQHLGLVSKSAVMYYPEHLKSFRTFIACAVVGHMLKSKKRKRRAAIRKKGRRYQVALALSFFYVPKHIGFSNEILAERLNVKKSTITNIKKKGNKLEYLISIPSFSPVNVETKLKKQWAKAFPEFANRMRTIKGKLYLQTYDNMRSLLQYKNRRKKIVP